MFTLRGRQTLNSGIGPILLATNSRPGPASIHSARRTRMPDAQTVDCDTPGRSRSPNRVAWRFPDWTAVGFRYREANLSAAAFGVAKRRTKHRDPQPIPRIHHRFTSRYQGAGGDWAGSAAGRRSFSSRGGRTLAATLTRIAWAFSRPLFSGGPVAGRRLPPCPQFIASHGISLLGSRTP